jgi:hemoglobin
MFPRVTRLRIAPVFGLLLLAACAGTSGNNGDLYRDLGGHEGIVAIVDRFLVELSDDPIVADDFRDSDIERFREKLIEQLCNLSGGPCEYTGDTMTQVHNGMGVDDAEFNHLVQDLIDAMNHVGTSPGAQNRLLALLAPMHGDIVEAPGPFRGFQ